MIQGDKLGILVTNIEFMLPTFFKPSCSMRSRRWSSWNCTCSSTLIAMLFNCKQSSHIGWYRTCLLSSVASFSAGRIIRLHHFIAIYQLLFTWYLRIICDSNVLQLYNSSRVLPLSWILTLEIHAVRGYMETGLLAWVTRLVFELEVLGVKMVQSLWTLCHRLSY